MAATRGSARRRNRPTPRPPRRFVLRREVLTAYAAPALTAGTAGVLGGRQDLAVAACTTIAGTSAVVAFLVGSWLRRGGRPRPWTTEVPRTVLTLLLVAATAGAAALLGRCAAEWLPAHAPLPHAPLPYGPFPYGPWRERLPVDLPLSAALATTAVTLRWRGTLAKPSV
ncbi:hypothetical protein ACIA6E_02450 [Streptomyces sp. NPDC051815]|uniref:hypothetical protein n=1 Tax=Streptomyces sp. NPDC051815 TaxID=3365674 RepID=UPI0037BBAE83